MNTLGLVFRGLGLGLVGFSTINLRLFYLQFIVSAIYSLSRLKNEETLESLTEYSTIKPIFHIFSYVFFKGLINLKNYDDRLYVNVDDLAV